jgi:hypothetical protein
MISNPAAAPNKHTLLRSLSLDPADDVIKSTLEKTPFKSCCFGMVESKGEGNSVPLAQIKSLVVDKRPTAEEAGILELESSERERERI